MKRAFLSLLVATVVLGGTTFARDLKTINGEVFKNIAVQSKNAIGVQFMHDDGVVFLDFKSLSDADQKEFGYNPETYADAYKQKFEAEKQRRELAELAARQAIAIARGQAIAAEQATAAAQADAQATNQSGLQVSVDSPGFTYGGYPVGGFLIPGVTTVVTPGRGRNALPCLPGFTGATVGPLEIRHH